MHITGSTTVSELQIELAKLGIDSLVWNVLARNHAITLIGAEGRIIEHGNDFVEVISAAVSRYADKVGVNLIFDHRKRISEEDYELLKKYKASLDSARLSKDREKEESGT